MSEDINKILPLKRVFLIWRQEIAGFEFPKWSWGLGDLIRGTMTTFEICKRLEIELIVDLSFHPISKYLKNSTTVYTSYLQKNILKLRGFIQDINLDKLFREEEEEEIIIQTNADPRLQLSFDSDFSFDEICKNFIIDLLEPSLELFEEITWYKLKLPQKYNIIHIRLPDEDLLEGIPIDYTSFLSEIKTIYKRDDIIVTNSNNFRKFIENNDNEVIQLNIGDVNHTGIQNDCEGIKNTLIEFFIISEANVIFTYSTYGWLSNFIKWISICKNIQVIDLNAQTFFN